MIIRCRHRIPSPEAAGYETLEGLKAAAARYPHLRPCPKQAEAEHEGTRSRCDRPYYRRQA